jgi:hypothetical protein
MMIVLLMALSEGVFGERRHSRHSRQMNCINLFFVSERSQNWQRPHLSLA